MSSCHYISSWAGGPTTAPTTFERCVRLHFLRRGPFGLRAPADSSSGEFAYGKDHKAPRLQPRLAALGAVLHGRGFRHFRRVGEGTEAFVVSALDAQGTTQMVRVSTYGVHITPDEDRLPCSDSFAFDDPADAQNRYMVTVAPPADTSSITPEDVVAFSRRQFARRHQNIDFSAGNLGRHNGRVVLVDYGVPLDPIHDLEREARSYARSLEVRLDAHLALRRSPIVLAFVAELMPHITPELQRALAERLPAQSLAAAGFAAPQGHLLSEGEKPIFV